MNAECPPDLYKLFSENIGGCVRPNEAGQQFLYDALGDHMDFTGVTAITIPPLDDAAFKSWEQFEYWCEETRLELMWKIVDCKSSDFDLLMKNYLRKNTLSRNLLSEKRLLKS